MAPTALVVDDSRTVRSFLSRALRGLGFTVHEAGDGQAGLDQLAAVGELDVALVDWNMPVLDGLGFVRAARALPGRGGMRILMVTTETELERMVEALDAGADEYLMKPFGADVLRSKLALVGLVEPAP